MIATSPRALLPVLCCIGLQCAPAAIAQLTCQPAGGLIPDNDPIGLVDNLDLSRLDVISDVNVVVHISHPIIGELHITLTHVSTGTTVVLRESAACLSVELNATFDDESGTQPGACPPGAAPIAGTMRPVSLLSAFDGEATAGTWELRVIDGLPGIAGVLLQWCLDFTVDGRSCNTPALAIPDFPAAGVTDTQTIFSVAAVGELSVVADITQPTVGDLVVTLTHLTTGTSVVLFDRGGCVEGDILTVFDDDAVVPAAGSCLQPVAVPFTVRPMTPLSAFAGEPLAGQWRLQVDDLATGDTGTLNQWCLVNGATGDCPLVLCGDCDGNQAVTILDSLLAAQHAAGLITLHGTALANCNVVGAVEPAAGAAVDVLDSLFLAQFAAGLAVILGCC